MTPDEFFTICEPGLAETRVRGSRFFGRAMSAECDEDIGREVTIEKKRFHDATHWCWALRLRSREGIVERSSDGGEPHGSAGQPILRQVQARGLSNCLVIVTRYFGGTKLGVGNLARAYGECAKLALENAVPATRRVYRVLNVTCRVSDVSILYSVAKRHGAIIEAEESERGNLYRVKCIQTAVDGVMRDLIEHSADRISVHVGETWIS